MADPVKDWSQKGKDCDQKSGKAFHPREEETNETKYFVPGELPNKRQTFSSLPGKPNV